METKITEKIDIPHYTESIFYELRRTARIFKVHADQIFLDLKMGLSSEEYCILDVIMCNPDICQRDVAKLVFRDRANTGRILEKLEEMKLIERNIDTKNNRLIKKISITKNGVDMINKVNELIIERYMKVSSQISIDEVEAIRLSLQKLSESIEKQIKNTI